MCMHISTCMSSFLCNRTRIELHCFHSGHLMSWACRTIVKLLLSCWPLGHRQTQKCIIFEKNKIPKKLSNSNSKYIKIIIALKKWSQDTEAVQTIRSSTQVFTGNQHTFCALLYWDCRNYREYMSQEPSTPLSKLCCLSGTTPLWRHLHRTMSAPRLKAERCVLDENRIPVYCWRLLTGLFGVIQTHAAVVLVHIHLNSTYNLSMLD